MMPVVMLKKRIGFQLAIYFGTPSMYGFNTNPLPHAYMLAVPHREHICTRLV